MDQYGTRGGAAFVIERNMTVWRHSDDSRSCVCMDRKVHRRAELVHRRCIMNKHEVRLLVVARFATASEPLVR